VVAVEAVIHALQGFKVVPVQRILANGDLSIILNRVEVLGIVSFLFLAYVENLIVVEEIWKGSMDCDSCKQLFGCLG